MSQNPQKPRTKIEPKLESAIVIRQPMVRNFSTGGGQSARRHASRRRSEDRNEEVAGLPSGQSQGRWKADAANA